MRTPAMKQSNETAEGFKAQATDIVQRLELDFERLLKREIRPKTTPASPQTSPETNDLVQKEKAE